MPRDPAVHLLLGQALNKSGEHNEGSLELRAAQDMSQRERDTAVAKQLTITGTELLRAGHIPEAAAKLGESTRLNPNDAAAQYNYGLALLIQNRLEEAVDRLRTSLRLNPEDASGYYALGQALLAEGQPRDAVGPLREALRLSPDDARAHNVLAVALAETKDFHSASLELENAVKLEPHNSSFRSNLSCVQQRLEACRLIP
ncbi:MAG: hypothetical protein DMG26_02495 [Acidobacteria bacterium]|nr:MAG: hypothetical protein DMG26_02495 [Acidobacteriota bacterium]